MKAIVTWGKENSFSISRQNLLEGFVLFYQNSPEYPVNVKVFLKGVPDGAHGFHIHEKKITKILDGESAKDCCNKLGGHFNVGEKWSEENLDGVKHGHHTGDLCFNIVSEDGLVDFSFVDHKISLYPGENCILDRSLVIHEDPDDKGEGIYEEESLTVQSLITGNAGDRFACGNIQRIFE